jgi:uncharacterized protein YjdB
MTVYNTNDEMSEGAGIYVWNQSITQWQFAGYRSGPVVVPAEGITVTSAGNAEVVLSGGTLQFTAAVSPEGATNKAVFWEVVPGQGTGTITNEGLFTAEAPGSVQIKAVSADNPAIVGTKTITVSVPAKPVTSVTVRSNESKTTVVVSGTLQLYADVTPPDADNRTVNWTTSNSGVARVDEVSGLVTGQSPGTVRITATATDGSTEYGYIDLTVAPVLVTGFTVTASPSSIPHNSSAILTAGSFLPSNAELKEVTWEYISGPEGSGINFINTTGTTCEVYGGDTNGSIKIKATAKDAGGYSKERLIDVQDIMIQTITLAGSTCVRNDNAIRIYPASISPANAVDQRLSWSITGGGKIQSQTYEECWIVADGNGGTITVTATAMDGSEKTATYTSYGAVGEDKAGDDLQGTTFAYTTWQYPNGIGRWMTKNSKEGNYSYLQGNDGVTGEGGWYTRSNAASGCLSGWHYPEASELDALRAFHLEKCYSLEAKTAWWSAGRVGGYTQGTAPTETDKLFMHYESGRALRWDVEGLVDLISGSAWFFYVASVRCVEDQQ